MGKYTVVLVHGLRYLPVGTLHVDADNAVLETYTHSKVPTHPALRQQYDILMVGCNQVADNRVIAMWNVADLSGENDDRYYVLDSAHITPDGSGIAIEPLDDEALGYTVGVTPMHMFLAMCTEAIRHDDKGNR